MDKKQIIVVILNTSDISFKWQNRIDILFFKQLVITNLQIKNNKKQ